MKPYYEHAGIAIYHGDCREILPQLPGNAAICADPPYGIGYVNGAVNIPNATKFAGVAVIGDDEPFDPSDLLRYEHVLLWGANHYAPRLPGGRWLVWDKRCGVVPERDTSDCEFAWVRGSGGMCARMIRLYWDGFNKQTERGIPRVHPTQKPVEVMKWCFDFLPKDRVLVDPFMGSGTTLVAAKNLGREAIGIEIEERYCEIAARRLSQEVLNFEEMPA